MSFSGALKNYLCCRSRKGITPEMLVKIIALIAALLVILTVVVPPVMEYIKGAGGKGGCSFSLLISSIGKKASFGFGDIPPECKMERATITPQTLSPFLETAKKTVERYQTNAGSPIMIGSNEVGTAKDHFPNDERGYYRWALQKVVADKMVGCFERAWKGKLDIHNSLGTIVSKKNGEYTCLLCSRFIIDPQVQKLTAASPGGFLMMPWLQSNNYKGKTYADYLKEGVNERWTDSIDYSGFKLNTPYAVLYIAGAEVDSKGGVTGTATGAVTVLPYEDLTRNIGFEQVRETTAPGSSVPVVGKIFNLNPIYWMEVLLPWASRKITGKQAELTTSGIKMTTTAKCAVIIGD